jgi:hypothetical protein
MKEFLGCILGISFLAIVLAGGALLPAEAQDQASSINHVRNNGYRSAAITNGAAMLPTSAVFNGDGSACNITMQLNGDSTTLLWQDVQPGEILPVQAVLVASSGTTCTNLVAIYDR